jgi:hypothetical protein
VNLRSSLRTLAFASVCALPLPAGVVTINFTETGGNVVVTLSGSLTDPTAWYAPAADTNSAFIAPSSGDIVFGGTGVLYFPNTYPSTGTWTGGFGSGSSPISASTRSGDTFAIGVAGGALVVPTGYDFNNPTNLSSTMTFNSATFLSLGITPTATSAIFDGDEIRLTFGSGGGSSVPDAGPGPALALMLGGLGLRQWHSSRRSRAAA